MTIEWTLERKRLDDLIENECNPRILTKNQASNLRESIFKFGLIDKPIVNTNNEIIGGHQRIRLLREQGDTEVDAWVPSRPLSGHEVRQLSIRLNKNTGEWNWDILANCYEDTDLLDWGFNPSDFLLNFPDAILDDEEKEKKKAGGEKTPKNCPECGAEIK